MTMLVKEGFEPPNEGILQKMSLDNRECRMCGETPSTADEVFEDGICPHCLNMVETD
jgi:hypothetical protein